MPIQLFIDIPVHAIERFGTRDVSFAAAYAILVGAVLAWLAVYRKHRAFVRGMNRVTAALRRAASMDRPADRLGAADAAMGGSALAPLWRPYRAAIRERGGPVNLLAPGDWFALDRLPGRGYEAWAATWAGIFLTIGLLFTFVGLAAALLRVGDIGGGNEVDLRAATGAILQASSAKFITSIAGLLAFIGWSFGTRVLVAGQARVARELCSAVQDVTAPLAPETLLFLQVEHLEDQLATTRGLAEAVAAAIEIRMQPRLEALPEAIADSGRGVAEAVRVMGAGIGRINEAAIAQMVSQLGSDIRASVGLEMRAVSAVLREAAAELEGAKSGIASAGTELNRELAVAAERMQRSAEALELSFQAGAAGLGASGAEMSAVLESGARAAADLIGRSAQGVEGSLRSGAAKLEDSGAQAAAVLQSAIRIAAAAFAEALADAGATIRETAGEGARDLAGAARDAGRQLADAADESSASMRKEAAIIGKLLDGSEQGLTELQATVAAQADRLGHVGSAIGEASVEFGRASRSLRAAAKPLATTLEAVERVVVASEAALERHAARFGAADESLVQTLRLLRESLVPEPEPHHPLQPSEQATLPTVAA